MSLRVVALLIALATVQSATPARLTDACGDLAISLHCAELVPVPALRSVSGVLELEAPSTPFGVAITADGVPRHTLVVTLADLPPASSLGAYSTYVAWAASIAFGDEVRLGEVRNGTTRLGELAMLQFRVLITAEATATSSRRSGPLVMRGTSPAARRLAHRDMLSPASPGQPRGDAPGARRAGNIRRSDVAHAADGQPANDENDARDGRRAPVGRTVPAHRRRHLARSAGSPA